MSEQKYISPSEAQEIFRAAEQRVDAAVRKCREEQSARASAELSAMSEHKYGTWYGMESAPKDVTILVYHNAFTVAHFNSANDKWIGYGHNTGDTIWLNRHPPTHWMPLPDPPSLEPSRA